MVNKKFKDLLNEFPLPKRLVKRRYDNVRSKFVQKYNDNLRTYKKYKWNKSILQKSKLICSLNKMLK